MSTLEKLGEKESGTSRMLFCEDLLGSQLDVMAKLWSRARLGVSTV